MSFQPIADSSQIEEGRLFLHQTRYQRIAVTKIAEEFFAFEDVCTHDGEEISCGTLEGDLITCPRHGAKFCIRDGSVRELPATEPLTVYPIRIHQGKIEVDLD